MTTPSFTLTNLKGKVAELTGKTAASSAEWWSLYTGLTPPPVPIPPTVEDRLDRIDARLAGLGAIPIVTPTPAPAPAPAPQPTGNTGPVAGMTDGFNVAFYRAQNPDVVAAKINLFAHYLHNGKREGRLPYEGAPAATFPTASALPPLDLSDEALWNYEGRWMASDWDSNLGPAHYGYDHIMQDGTDTVFFMDAYGEPQLKAYHADGTSKDSGEWEVDVTLPVMRDGVVVAPLWLFNQDHGDEVDFEYAGRNGLNISLHKAWQALAGGKQVPGDVSGQRHTFGIKMDQAAGYADMSIDGVVVHRLDKTNGFPDSVMSPIIEMWAANPNDGGLVSWAGRWAGMAQDETMVMTVHGYSYEPL